MLVYKEKDILKNDIVLEIEKLNIKKNYHIKKQQTAFLYSNIIMYNSVNLNSNDEYIDFEKDMNELKIIFERIKKNIELLDCLIDKLNSLNIDEANLENLKMLIEEFNLLEEKNDKIILEQEQKNEEFFIHILSHINVNKNIKKRLKFIAHKKKCSYSTKTKKLYDKNKEEKTLETNRISSKKVLKISEKENKVYLPYDIVTLKDNLQKDSKYKTVDEFVQAKYVLPLDQFKNFTKSRFLEGYKLIKNKDNGSLFKAIKIGFELMFNYSLNPAVIAACQNLDELDIYLDCLEDNELDKFYIFDIIYEVAPMLSTTSGIGKRNKNI